LAVVTQFKVGDTIKIRTKTTEDWEVGFVDKVDVRYQQLFAKDNVGTEYQFSFSEFPQLFMK